MTKKRRRGVGFDGFDGTAVVGVLPRLLLGERRAICNCRLVYSRCKSISTASGSFLRKVKGRYRCLDVAAADNGRAANLRGTETAEARIQQAGW
jgi:hypothetical protein